MPKASSLLLVCAALAAVAAGPSAAQELRITCTVSDPAMTAAPLEFGLAAGALDGIDPRDEPLPPPAPDQTLLPYLQMLTPPVPLPNRWRADLRPFFDVSSQRVEIWAMTVESAAAGGDLVFSVTYAVSEPLPYALRLLGPDGLERPVADGDMVTVPRTAPIMNFYWELQYDEQVPTAPRTWGGVQALYR